MNRIRVSQLLLSGLITLVFFIVVELLWESLLIWVVWPRVAAAWELSAAPLDWSAAWRLSESPLDWSAIQHVLNIGIALINSIMMMWLYAALRPMFGVGTRTALISSAFVFVFVSAFIINSVNLGYQDLPYAVVEMASLIVELPIAIIFGARFYESGKWALDEY
jgi:hypothetical protein